MALKLNINDVVVHEKIEPEDIVVWVSEVKETEAGKVVCLDFSKIHVDISLKIKREYLVSEEVAVDLPSIYQYLRTREEFSTASEVPAEGPEWNFVQLPDLFQTV